MNQVIGKSGTIKSAKEILMQDSAYFEEGNNAIIHPDDILAYMEEYAGQFRTASLKQNEAHLALSEIEEWIEKNNSDRVTDSGMYLYSWVDRDELLRKINSLKLSIAKLHISNISA